MLEQTLFIIGFDEWCWWLSLWSGLYNRQFFIPRTNDQCVVNHDIGKNELSAIVGIFDSSAIDYDVGTDGNIDITITHINKF